TSRTPPATSPGRTSPASARGAPRALPARGSLRGRAERRVEHAPRPRPGDGVLHRDEVARAGEHELEGACGVRLDVVAPELQRIAARGIRARDGGEGDVVARLADEAEMHLLVVRLRALHVREGPHGTAEPVFQ